MKVMLDPEIESGKSRSRCLPMFGSNLQRDSGGSLCLDMALNLSFCWDLSASVMICQRKWLGCENFYSNPTRRHLRPLLWRYWVVTTIISELPKFCDFQISTKINLNKKMSKLFTFRQTQLLESHVSGHMVKREVTAEGEVQHHQHHQHHQQH